MRWRDGLLGGGEPGNCDSMPWTKAAAERGKREDKGRVAESGCDPESSITVPGRVMDRVRGLTCVISADALLPSKMCSITDEKRENYIRRAGINNAHSTSINRWCGLPMHSCREPRSRRINTDLE